MALRSKYNLEFEQIDDFHQRAKVIGGWVLKAYENVCETTPHNTFESGYNWRVAMCFIPDPNHEWQIENE